MEMKVDTVLKVLEGNRITLPKEFCTRVGVKKGDSVGLILEEGKYPRLIVIPVKEIKVTPRTSTENKHLE